MKKTQYFDVKKKLMAATSMVLVASTMMVSTTYAWFTLSTAPEVTGISTTVGANGNLEMALSPSTGIGTDITSAVGDSSSVTNKELTASNITWGNLVDLSDSSYGLDSISLMPAILNTTDASTLSLTNPYQIAEYGSDGRVTELNYEQVTSGIYSDTALGFDTTSTQYGVRAIGTVSGKTTEELVYTSAKSLASSYSGTTKSAAQTTLTKYGSTLGSLAINLSGAVSDDIPTTITASEYSDINGVLTGLQTSVSYIEMSIKQVIIANIASEGTLTGDTLSAAQDYIEVTDLETLALDDTYGTYFTAYSDYINDYTTLKTTIETAIDDMSGLSANSDGTYDVDDVQDTIDILFDSDEMLINDMTLDEFQEEESFSLSNMTITMADGSGVYADIAEFTGDFNATVSVPVSAGGYNVDMSVTLTTAATNTYLSTMYAAIGAAPTGGTGNTLITDTYGYALDLFFRTNATDSSLTLSDAVSRVYEGATDATMGGGSSMTFTSTATGFEQAKLEALMDCIRLAFVDPTDGAIYGYAKLDTANGTAVEGTSVGLTALLDLYSDEDCSTPQETIMELQQNTEQGLSVYVYLDGESVDNTMVANALESMTGTLNLQFASTATLIPMSNTDLYTMEGDSASALASARLSVNSAMATLKASYSEDNYSTENWGTIEGLFDTAETTVNAFTTVDEINAFYNSINPVTDSPDAYGLDALETALEDIEVLVATEEDVTEPTLAEYQITVTANVDTLLIATYTEGDYDSEDWTAMTGLVTTAKTDISEDTTNDEVDGTYDALVSALEAYQTTAEKAA
ncbi:MAG: hypothetical protein R3Y09_10490 [Clostridia bacterium]